MARSIESGLAFASARALVEQIRARKIGCVELFDFYRERVERLDPRINAIVVRRFETARKIAANCDAALARGDAVGPLHGLPMTIKESFDLPELPTTWGFREYADNRAVRAAVVAERFEKAGAVIFGKTNVPVALADWQSFNPIYGTTNNPWNVGRTPGGSSGGSAAALAAGLTALELGSDIGGSIRNPAHYCGVYGHKPTFDIVPRDGQALPGSYAFSDISVAGPLARSAFDLELALDTVAGPNDFYGRGWKLTLPKPRHAKLSDYRVAVMTTTPEADVDEAVQAPIEALAAWLERKGARVERSVTPVDPAVVNELFILMRFATTGRMTPEYRDDLLQKREALGSRTDFYATMVRALTMSHFEWLQHNNLRHRLLQEWRRFFERFDVFLCPTAATTAFPHDHVGDRWERSITVNGVAQPHTHQLFWAGYSGLFFLPSTVAPIARAADGLPVGVQIVGAEYDDRTCLHFAQQIEREYYAFEAPPDF